MMWQILGMISNCQEPILVKQTIYRFCNNCLFLFLFRMIYYPTSQWFLQAGSVRHEETTARRVTECALAEKKKKNIVSMV